MSLTPAQSPHDTVTATVTLSHREVYAMCALIERTKNEHLLKPPSAFMSDVTASASSAAEKIKAAFVRR